MKKCADKIDVVRQKEIFDDYYAMTNWTQKTLFLRSLSQTSLLRKQLNPILNMKERKHVSKILSSRSQWKKTSSMFNFFDKNVKH